MCILQHIKVMGLQQRKGNLKFHMVSIINTTAVKLLKTKKNKLLHLFSGIMENYLH